MARPLDAGGGDDIVAQQRAKARLMREHAEARRANVRAAMAEGSVIRLEDAKAEIMELAASVRHALTIMPSFLPAHLSPEEREACSQAMASAAARAMQSIEIKERKNAPTQTG